MSIESNESKSSVERNPRKRQQIAMSNDQDGITKSNDSISVTTDDSDEVFQSQPPVGIPSFEYSSEMSHTEMPASSPQNLGHAQSDTFSEDIQTTIALLQPQHNEAQTVSTLQNSPHTNVPTPVQRRNLPGNQLIKSKYDQNIADGETSIPDSFDQSGTPFTKCIEQRLNYNRMDGNTDTLHLLDTKSIPPMLNQNRFPGLKRKPTYTYDHNQIFTKGGHSDNISQSYIPNYKQATYKNEANQHNMSPNPYDRITTNHSLPTSEYTHNEALQSSITDPKAYERSYSTDTRDQIWKQQYCDNEYISFDERRKTHLERSSLVSTNIQTPEIISRNEKEGHPNFCKSSPSKHANFLPKYSSTFDNRLEHLDDDPRDQICDVSKEMAMYDNRDRQLNSNTTASISINSGHHVTERGFVFPEKAALTEPILFSPRVVHAGKN